jgi:Tfp pilus assembly protein PilW
MRPDTKKGVTLTEAMISTVLFTFLMTGLYASLEAGRLSFSTQSKSVTAQQEVRKAIDQLSRELRSVESASVSNSSSAASLSYTHPTEGTVSYTWTNDTGDPNAMRLLRTNSTSSRIIAQNISAVSFTNNLDNYIINITASADADMGGPAESFQLIKKIGVR